MAQSCSTNINDENNLPTKTSLSEPEVNLVETEVQEVELVETEVQEVELVETEVQEVELVETEVQEVEDGSKNNKKK